MQVGQLLGQGGQAFETFQTEQGIAATGEIDDPLLQRLAPPAT